MSSKNTSSVPAIHYVVKTGFNPKTQKFSETVFSDKEPFLARKKAFEFMNNYVEILQENRLMRRTSKMEQVPFGEPDEYFYDQLENYNQRFPLFIKPKDFPDGISLYMEVNEPIDYMNIQDKKGNRYLIYSVIRFNSEKIRQMIGGLKREYGYFQKFRFNDYNSSEVIDFRKFLSSENSMQNFSYTCLPTPMDWHFHYFLDEKEKIDNLLTHITKGELKNNAFLTKISAKNIERELASLLNTAQGGRLFLGINQTRQAKPVFDQKSALDMIRVHKTLMESMFDNMAQLISVKMFRYQEEYVLVYTVDKNLTTPVYTERNGIKKFYTRNKNGLRKIEDIEEIVNYCFMCFEKKIRGIQELLDIL